ncbi:MAG: BatA domain-containing protein [Pirellulales bacterium]
MGGWWASGYWWAGIAAASIPVLVHWFRRQQRRKVRWAPMALLQPTVVRRQRRWRLRDAGLMALRIAAMILIGTALARPRWWGSQAFVSSGDSSAVIVVVDNSFSMGFTRLGQTNWDRAEPILAELLDTLPIGTQVCLVPACVDDRALTSFGFGPAGTAKDRWHELSVLDRAVEPSQVLARLLEVARQAPVSPQMVYWITDHQRRNFLTLGAETWPEELPPLRVVPLDESTPGNLWIEDLQVRPEVLVAGDTAELQVLVGRVGPDLPPQVPVQLWAGDQEIGTQLVKAPDEGSWVTVRFEYRVPQGKEPAAVAVADSIMFRASLPADGLPGDDQRFAVASVVAASPLAFVSTEPSRSPDATGEASFYLREFWQSTNAAESAPLAAVELLNNLVESRLHQHPVVVLTGGPPPSDGAVRMLRNYVRQGGQLWIAPDDDFDPEAWNRAAWLNGDGLLPAPLRPITGSPVREKLQADAIRRIDLKSIQNRSLGDLPGVSSEALSTLYGEVILLALIATEELPEVPEAGAALVSRPQVLLRTDRGEPLATYRSWGDGGVLFWGTGLRPTWNNMAASSGVICWEHVVRFLLNRARQRTQFLPDQVPAIRLGALDSSWEWELQRVADGRPVDVAWRVRSVLKGTRIEFDSTLPRGGYLLRGTSRNQERQLVVPVGIAPAPTTWESSESNLGRMDAATWALVEARLQASGGGTAERVSVGEVQGDHAWRMVIVAVLVCLLIEGLICARLSGDATPATTASGGTGVASPGRLA